MDYLKRMLGIQVNYGGTAHTHLPNFITSRYRVQKVSLDGQEAFFVYVLTELEAIEPLKKHISRIQSLEDIPAVLILERLTSRQREYLLRERIPFIVDEKQIYLPFLAVCLPERCDAEIAVPKEILPSSQVLLLYFIYHGCGRLAASRAVKDLKLTSTSVSRAVRQLERLGLIHTEKQGVQKILCSELTPAQLFYTAKAQLQSPVKRTVYVPADQISAGMLQSGYSALAEYSLLNLPNVTCYAAKSITRWALVSTETLQSTKQQAAIEYWRYDPAILSGTAYVDRLSLALSLRDNTDERTEEAVEEMLAQLWREINGNRN